MILLIDNYDSFTYNLYQYIGEIVQDILVVRNDSVTIDDIQQMDLKAIILSPGPGVPEKTGICIDIIKTFGGKIPILGVCLGHQAIAYAYGAKVIRAATVKHGKTSIITHTNDMPFQGLNTRIEVMRYHSLVVEESTLPPSLMITAKSLDDGAIMAIKHKDHAVFGVQFHPESIFTIQGNEIISNFLSEFG